MSNPANAPDIRVTDENRVPMGLPTLMLEVPKIEGYVMHWFATRPGRIEQAMRGGYEFVTPEEVQLNNHSIATDVKDSGNTDLGTRVSVYAGAGETGGAERLYLMKIRQDWYDRDMSLREEASDRVVEALKQGQTGAEKDRMTDAAKRYAKNTDNLFTKHKRR